LNNMNEFENMGSSLAKTVRFRRRLATGVIASILFMILGAVLGVRLYEYRAAEAKLASVQKDYISTWCSTFGQIEFDASVPHQEWKAKLREDFDFDSSLEEWKSFASRNDEFLRNYPDFYLLEPSGKQTDLIISIFWSEDFYSWSNFESTQEMIKSDLEYTFWPLHEVFGNEVNEFGKLRPSC
jgi:hypothetical protein